MENVNEFQRNSRSLPLSSASRDETICLRFVHESHTANPENSISHLLHPLLATISNNLSLNPVRSKHFQQLLALIK